MSSERIDNLSASIGALLFGKRRHTTQDRKTSLESPTKPSRTRSLENLVDIKDANRIIDGGSIEDSWSEVEAVKPLGPVVVCILPSLAQDFVVSGLIAMGANPLIPEDPKDVEKYISDCKAILVNTSARKEIIEALLEHYISGLVPFVLVCQDAGTNDQRKALARKIIEKCEPTLVSGRLGDIHALGEDILERVEGVLDDGEGEGIEDADGDYCLRPLSPRPMSPRSPKLQRKKPVQHSHFEKRVDKNKHLHRANTPIPQMVMKGQFRHQHMKHISPALALSSGRKLAAHQSCFIHLFEINALTCGEFFIEINNAQFGMENLHSTVTCAAGIIASLIACVEDKGDEVTLTHCSHGLAFFHVAAEEASLDASYGSDLPHPGTLRVKFLDQLHKLDELAVRLKAKIQFHNTVNM